MIRVSLSDPVEYLDEIRTDCQLLERGIVRVAIRVHQGGLPPHTALWVVASHVVGECVVVMEHRVGGFGAEGDYAADVRRRAYATADKIREEARALGLTVRPGAFGPGGAS